MVMFIRIYIMYSIIKHTTGDNLCLTQCKDMLVWLAKGDIPLPKLQKKPNTLAWWIGTWIDRLKHTTSVFMSD
jgi:hypothetical protein